MRENEKPNARKNKRMIVDEFETIRDFNEKFPSKIFICSKCNSLVPDPYQCNTCGCQSNNFLFSDKSYSYIIKGQNQISTIFRPIEMENNK